MPQRFLFNSKCSRVCLQIRCLANFLEGQKNIHETYEPKSYRMQRKLDETRSCCKKHQTVETSAWAARARRELLGLLEAARRLVEDHAERFRANRVLPDLTRLRSEVNNSQ